MKTMSATKKTALVVLALAAALSSEAATPKYRLQLLPTAGLLTSRATALNNNGHVVGTATTSSSVNVAFHYGPSMSAMPVPTGFATPIPTAINDNGDIVGYGTKTISGGTRLRGFYWSDYFSTPVEIMPFNAYAQGKSWLNDINDYGLTAGAANGWIFNGGMTEPMKGMYYNAPANVKYYGDTLTQTEAAISEFRGMNNDGMLVGVSTGADGKLHGVKKYGSLTMIADPAGTTNGVYLNAVNNYHTMVGEYWVSVSQSKAFYRTEFGTAIDIPRLTGASSDDANNAVSINSRNEIVGSCEIGNTNQRGYYFADGVSTNLNSVTSDLGAYTITDAAEINDKSQIAATVKNASGVQFAALLIPQQTIQGSIVYEDWSTYPSYPVVSYQIFDEQGQVVQSSTFKTNILGTFSLNTDIEKGEIVMKASHWLSRRIAFDLTTFGTKTINTSFVNGDCDGDNSVTVFDYGILNDSWDKSLGDAAFDARADLDGDNSVTVFDYGILSTNFDKSGE